MSLSVQHAKLKLDNNVVCNLLLDKWLLISGGVSQREVGTIGGKSDICLSRWTWKSPLGVNSYEWFFTTHFFYDNYTLIQGCIGYILELIIARFYFWVFSKSYLF